LIDDLIIQSSFGFSIFVGFISMGVLIVFSHWLC